MAETLLAAPHGWLALCERKGEKGVAERNHLAIVAWAIDHDGTGNPIVTHDGKIGYPGMLGWQLVDIDRA
jgi:hypothetical protein